MSTDIDLLKSILTENKLSVTKARSAVLTAMSGKDPITISQLIQATPDIDRASVYRIITLFESLGIVNRIQQGWKYKLELSDKFNHHHHHISCSQCGAINELPHNSQIEKLIDELAFQQKYTPVSHQIEVIGVCRNCRIK